MVMPIQTSSHDTRYTCKEIFLLKDWVRMDFDTFYARSRHDFLKLNDQKRNKEDLEDAFHDALLALFDHRVTRDSFHSVRHLKAYLIGVAKHKWLATFRKMSRIHFYGEITDNLYKEGIKSNKEKATLEQVLKALEQMSPKSREIINRYYFQEQNLSKIAVAMKLKDTNVAANALFRARVQLKNLMKYPNKTNP